MTDELLRPFRDKIRGRPAASNMPDESSTVKADDLPADAVVIREVEVGFFPEASRLHPGFVPGIPRVRLTLDVGAGLRSRLSPLHPEGRDALLDLCPRLRDHVCGGGEMIRHLLAPERTETTDTRRPVPSCDDGDGVSVAHLIEHVAIELIVGVSGVSRCSGVTCAYRERLDRFDVFVECVDPLAGRAAVVLAAAVVRDLCLRHPGRLALHRRCRELLAILSSSRAVVGMVAEDAGARLSCDPREGLQVLEELVRLGYLVAAPAAYLFSSATGVLFRRAGIEVRDA